MNPSITLLAILLLGVLGYYYGRSGAVRQVGGQKNRLNALPGYYGTYVGFWAALPTVVLYVAWLVLDDRIIRSLLISNYPKEKFLDIGNGNLSLAMSEIARFATGQRTPPDDPVLRQAIDYYAYLHSLSNWMLFGICAALAVAALAYAYRRISPGMYARQQVERVVMWLLFACAFVAVATTVGIVLSMLFESIRFFSMVPIQHFLFGLEWSPFTAIREGQAAAEGQYGAVPLFAGTFLITGVAMLVAIPIGLFAAIYLSEYAPKAIRGWVKPVIEVLAGIPTVVYGFFALIVFAPAVQDIATALGIEASAQSGLAAGMVMGIMIIPFISSLSDDVINSVPQAMRDGAYALGATKSETVKRVVLPAALPGIVGAVLLGMSRAIGETMIVVMAAGLEANLTANPLQTVTTVTVQIVKLLTGDAAMDTPKTLSAFALGLTLFVVTLILNVIALVIVRRYRERYE